MRRVAEAPVFWLLTRRPQAPPVTQSLIDAAHVTYPRAFTEVPLTQLTRDDSRRLVANLLEIDTLPESVRDLIVARSDGNPFFVEEVIRMLIERDALEHRGDAWVASGAISAVEIPDTIHGLLLSRIDALPPETRRALLVASVIGRTFAVPVLERVLRPA
jgi:predicted ATPase